MCNSDTTSTTDVGVLTSIAANLETCMFRMRKDGTFVYLSSTIEKVTGYPSQIFDSIQTFIKLTYASHDIHQQQRHIQDCLCNQITFNTGFQIRCRNDSLKWISINCIAVTAGEEFYFDGTIKDTHAAEDGSPTHLPNEIINLIQHALSGSDAAIWSWRPGEKKFDFFLSGLNEINPNWNEKNIRDVYKYVHPNDIPKLKDAINEAVEKGTSYSTEYRELNAETGEYVTLWAIGNVERDIENDHTIRLSGVTINVTEKKRLEEKLAWLANHDSLTKLYNRRYFQDEFSKALKKFQRFRQPGALLFVDVDQFKPVNDTCGHQVGDLLLSEIAEKLQCGIRETDTLARLGGDEFAILLEQTDYKGTISVAEKICELTNHIEVTDNSIVHVITVSIGIALFPEHGESVDTLIAHADSAMYQAKSERSATSNWCIYSPEAAEEQKLKNENQMA